MTDYNMTDNSQEDSDDSSYEGILKPAIEIQIPVDFNPKNPPQTGEEYLQHVIYERKKCKTWVSSNMKTDSFANNQTFTVDSDSLRPPLKTVSVPSDIWQQERLQDFQLLRKFVQTKLAAEQMEFEKVTAFDEDSFAKLILNPTCVNVLNISYLGQYTQAIKVRMLQMACKYGIENETWSIHLGALFYGLLTLLRIPLSPSSCYVLRQFARKCIQVRNHVYPNSDQTVPLNLFICVVGRYFNQFDLAD